VSYSIIILIISLYCGEGQFVDAYRWERFLIEHFPRLLRFNFKFCSLNIDQYRHLFWLDKHWYVAYDSSNSFLYTVPYFAPSLINHLSSESLTVFRKIYFYNIENYGRLHSKIIFRRNVVIAFDLLF
jgi:hypothetical protein